MGESVREGLEKRSTQGNGVLVAETGVLRFLKRGLHGRRGSYRGLHGRRGGDHRGLDGLWESDDSEEKLNHRRLEVRWLRLVLENGNDALESG